jgi:hypothetical protein
MDTKNMRITGRERRKIHPEVWPKIAQQQLLFKRSLRMYPHLQKEHVTLGLVKLTLKQSFER